MESQALARPAVVRAVQRWVARQPAAVAVVDGSHRRTYAQLWQDGLAWAGAIAANVDGPEPVVAIQRPRDADLPAVQLGAWLAGAAYLPVDPGWPAGWVAQILDRADCAVVVTGAGVVARDRAAPAGGQGVDPLAYVISTSGSTGTPKGVEIGHPGLGQLLAWYGRRFQLGPGVRIAMTAGLGFDQSVLDVWGALASGGTLVVAGERTVTDIDALVSFFDDAGIAHSYLPAALTERLFASATWPRTVRSLDSGGEALRRWPPAGFPCAVHNGYGPTEATILATLSGDLRGYARDGEPPIGRAVAGASLRLVDDTGNPIDEPGREGELLIAGPGLARGYRRDPTATRLAFRSRAGARWYHTGDLCHWNDHGELVFAGRRDGQVKVRGFRVELGHVERALLACPGVRQAAAAAVGDGDRSGLQAWIVGTADPAAVRAELATRLPGYLVPAAIHTRPELPLTLSGKVDRAGLVAAAAQAPAGLPDAYESVAEELAAAAWVAVLGQWPRRTDGFFAIGGDSLAAAQVTARLRDTLGPDLSLAVLLERPVLRDYASEVDRLLRRPPTGAERPVRIARTGSYPLSCMQQSRLAKESDAVRAGRPGLLNFVPLVLELRGRFTDDQVEAALAALLRRHEALRTGFPSNPATGSFGVTVTAGAPTGLRVTRFDADTEARRRAEVVAEQRRLAGTPLDLARPPLWRPALLRFTDDHAVLVLVVDHLVLDGVAADVVTDELAGFLGGEPPVGGDSEPWQHLDWVAWQRRRLSGDGRADLVAHWRARLAGTQPFPRLRLPAGPARPPGRTAVPVGLGPERIGALLEHLARHGATPLIGALHAVATGWCRTTGDTDLVVHMPVANRTLPEFERIVGWLAHMLPLRLRLDPAGGAVSTLGGTRAAVLDALSHQDLPLPELLRELQPEAYGRARRPDRLFFGYEAARPRAWRDLAGREIRRLYTPDHETRAEPGLSCYATLTDTGLVIEVVTDPARVDPAFTGSLAGAVRDALHELVLEAT